VGGVGRRGGEPSTPFAAGNGEKNVATAQGEGSRRRLGRREERTSGKRKRRQERATEATSVSAVKKRGKGGAGESEAWHKRKKKNGCPRKNVLGNVFQRRLLPAAASGKKGAPKRHEKKKKEKSCVPLGGEEKEKVACRRSMKECKNSAASALSNRFGKTLLSRARGRTGAPTPAGNEGGESSAMWSRSKKANPSAR